MLPKIGLTLASLLVTLLVMELAIRLLLPQNLSGSFTVVTPTGLAVNKSHGVTRHQFGERVLHYRFYEPGLRDTPIPPSGTGIKILVLGDSYTFGWLLEYEDTYVGRLQRMADEAFGKGTFVFLNAGGPGWGTSAELAYLEDFGPRVDPDIVLVFVNAGDIGRSLKRRIYTPDPDNLAEVRRNDLPGFGLKELLNAIPGYQWSLEHSHLIQLVRNKVAMPSVRPHELRADNLIHGPRANHPTLPPQAATNYARVLFTRLNKWCTQNDAALWVTTTGWFDTSGLSSPSNEIPTYAFIRNAGEIFRELGVPFHDLAPHVFATKQADPERYIILGEGHPNELGAKLIADSAFEHFVGKQLAEYCQRAGGC